MLKVIHQRKHNSTHVVKTVWPMWPVSWLLLIFVYPSIIYHHLSRTHNHRDAGVSPRWRQDSSSHQFITETHKDKPFVLAFTSMANFNFDSQHSWYGLWEEVGVLGFGGHIGTRGQKLFKLQTRRSWIRIKPSWHSCFEVSVIVIIQNSDFVTRIRKETSNIVDHLESKNV